ncbi:type II secretion system F family protein [Demequina mangrovi]|uniref:Type II secretion system protein F (GspF) n=1 Tax=Demequina mangrovi TaxID=1043493 RepID=A0A1H6Y6J0_9MICO|nr:type II secretion system F family protein [Demequina mangrovi]SEJ32802.1 type II secretion system protein F (GspF) [Demequina mangrovi]
MDAVLGLVLGIGLLLVWLACWDEPVRRSRPRVRRAALEDRLVQAGLPGVTAGAFGASAVGIGLVAAVLTWSVAGSAVVAALAGAAALYAPFALVASRARARRARLRVAWPEAVDALVSGIRAGLGLPDALAALGERGPEPLRPAFAAFGEDYRATGAFGPSLDALKAALADPVADRLVEAVRLARDVGGTEVGAVLRSLAQFLRDDARVRGELEARQGWTVSAARLAAAAPWLLLALLATRPEGLAAFDSPGGVALLVGGAVACLGAYRLMHALGRLPSEARALR